MTDQYKVTEQDLLTAREAARRLGVKVETVYAYVSRGLLGRERSAGRRGSRFRAADVDALAARGRRAAFDERAGPVLDTRLTAIADGELRYRGRDAVGLARRRSFEAVAHWLWTGADGPPDPAWTASPAALPAARAAQAMLPPGVPPADRMRVILAVAAPLDPFRYDLGSPVVIRTAAGLIATLVEGLPLLAEPTRPAGLAAGDEPRLASALLPRLAPGRSHPGLVECLNATLVLLADHELATSTFAARVAASVRADPYSVVTAGLGAVAGRLHGGAGARAARLLEEIGRPADVIAVLAEHLKRSPRLPGFGHPLYPGGDPRAREILRGLAAARLTRTAAARLRTAEHLLEVVATRGIAPNVDFALGTLAFVTGMAPAATEAIFALARSAGWIAHALEEYTETPLRFRARGTYVGAPPDPGPHPIPIPGHGR